MAKKKNTIIRDIAGGQFLIRENVSKSWPFIIYIVLLIFIYMSLNIVVVSTKKTKSKNSVEIKNLKADYISKEAKLQNQSSREQIIIKLKENGSTLQNPTHPAQKVKLKVDQD